MSRRLLFTCKDKHGSAGSLVLPKDTDATAFSGAWALRDPQGEGADSRTSFPGDAGSAPPSHHPAV